MVGSAAGSGGKGMRAAVVAAGGPPPVPAVTREKADMYCRWKDTETSNCEARVKGDMFGGGKAADE